MTDAARKFFLSNYHGVAAHSMSDRGHKAVIGRAVERRCRYCGRAPSDGVTFRKRAHALPELIGNKWLFSADECDACNAHFATHIDSHLASYLGVARTLSQIRGKVGVPQTGRSRTSHVKVTDKVEIHQYAGDEIATLDRANNAIHVVVTRQPYVPVAVYKAFVKMAYALMSTEIRQVYGHLRSWILDQRHVAAPAGYRPLVVYHQFIPGPMPIAGVRVALLQRNDPAAKLPHLVFFVGFANYGYQIALPLPSQLSTGPVGYEMYYFPIPADVQPKGPIARGELDFTGEDLVEGHQQKLTLSYDEMTERIL